MSSINRLNSSKKFKSRSGFVISVSSAFAKDVEFDAPVRIPVVVEPNESPTRAQLEPN